MAKRYFHLLDKPVPRDKRGDVWPHHFQIPYIPIEQLKFEKWKPGLPKDLRTPEEQEVVARIYNPKESQAYKQAFAKAQWEDDRPRRIIFRIWSWIVWGTAIFFGAWFTRDFLIPEFYPINDWEDLFGWIMVGFGLAYGGLACIAFILTGESPTLTELKPILSPAGQFVADNYTELKIIEKHVANTVAKQVASEVSKTMKK